MLNIYVKHKSKNLFLLKKIITEALLLSRASFLRNTAREPNPLKYWWEMVSFVWSGADGGGDWRASNPS